VKIFEEKKERVNLTFMTNKKLKYFKKTIKYILMLLASGIFFSGIFFFLVYAGIFGPLPNEEVLKSIKNEEASLVYSSDEILIGKYFAENRTNINWEAIPNHLINALIATEDKRFFEHKGYDTQSYLRVFIKSILLRDSSGGGGSTITQQLIKNLFGRNNFAFLSLPVNKVKEIIIAARMEAIYSKEELLLLYLNSVPFGENVYGIESAAHRYFNKATHELQIEESAVLVGMLKANTFYNPRLHPENSLERRNTVLNLMGNEEYLTINQVDSLKKIPLKVHYDNVEENAPAGYFVYQVKKKTLDILESIKVKTGKDYNLEKDGLKIYTTLDINVQKLAKEAVKKHLIVMQKLLDKELENQNVKKKWLRNQLKKANASSEDIEKRAVEIFDWEGTETKNMSKLDSLWHYYKMLNAAVLITNPKNGAVLTYIGGNNFQKLPFDMVLSHRQIASAFKPILYATALESGFKADTYLQNEEKEYPEYENWKPQNFDYQSTPDSTVAFWYALANSMNLPTVDLYFKVGREQLINTCNKLDFPHFKKDAPSIALGSLDLSLSEIVKAYSTFANDGKMNDLVMISKITDAKGNIVYKNKTTEVQSIFSKQTSETITAILQKAINEGTGTKIRNQFGIQSDLAGKTGTAQNYSNAWFMAYTPNLVIGTWVGASSPNVHFYSGRGSGASLALPITGAILKGMEGNSRLRNTYLTSFEITESTYVSITCEPYREVGVSGFFNRFFKKKDTIERNIRKAKRKKKKRFFIF
jgi:penicillin-binding protein 1A